MATADLLVDTDVLIDHLRGTRALRTAAGRLAVSVVSRAELFAGRDEHATIERLLSAVDELEVDAAIAERAGTIRRRSGIALPDALIAATALVHDLPLMTGNRRHFDRIAGLEVVAPG